MVTIPIGSRADGQAVCQFICDLGSLLFEQHQMLDVVKHAAVLHHWFSTGAIDDLAGTLPPLDVSDRRTSAKLDCQR